MRVEGGKEKEKGEYSLGLLSPLFNINNVRLPSWGAYISHLYLTAIKLAMLTLATFGIG